MGGRGSASGVSVKGKEYGTEYTALLQSGNIKFVKINDGSPTAPLETMTKGRIYVTIDHGGNPKYITYHDPSNKKYKEIEIKGRPHRIDGKLEIPHVHYGHIHSENGTFTQTDRDKRIIDNVMRIWDNHKSK